MESFAPWLQRLEKQISEPVLTEENTRFRAYSPRSGASGKFHPPALKQNPFRRGGTRTTLRLLGQIHRRRARVAQLLVSAKRSNRQPFPFWGREV
jgi:hypothetical protein